MLRRMATVSENIDILDRYFFSGGEFGPEVQRTKLDFDGTFGLAMRELVFDAAHYKEARAIFAQSSILEKTLSPPSLVDSRYVRASLQQELIDGIYKAATGGWWWPAWPSGITEWLGSEAGGRAYFLATLFSPPRVVDMGGYNIEVPLAPEVLAGMLRIVIDVALPASWYKPLMDQKTFDKISIRIANSNWDATTRRGLLALNAEALKRVVSVLAMEASTKAMWPSFPTGEKLPNGQIALASTPPPPPKRWWRNGWMLGAVGLGLIGGGTIARH